MTTASTSEETRALDLERTMNRVWALEEVAQRYVAPEVARDVAHYAFLLTNPFTRESAFAHMRIHCTDAQRMFTVEVARIALTCRYMDTLELQLATTHDWEQWIAEM